LGSRPDPKLIMSTGFESAAPDPAAPEPVAARQKVFLNPRRFVLVQHAGRPVGPNLSSLRRALHAPTCIDQGPCGLVQYRAPSGQCAAAADEPGRAQQRPLHQVLRRRSIVGQLITRPQQPVTRMRDKLALVSGHHRVASLHEDGLLLRLVMLPMPGS
jgi:hypothetical protein